MADASGRPARRRHLGFIVPGDHVRILAGRLAGLVGVVVRLTEQFNCILLVEGFTKGTYLRASILDLQRLEDAGC